MATKGPTGEKPKRGSLLKRVTSQIFNRSDTNSITSEASEEVKKKEKSLFRRSMQLFRPEEIAVQNAQEEESLDDILKKALGDVTWTHNMRGTHLEERDEGSLPFPADFQEKQKVVPLIGRTQAIQPSQEKKPKKQHHHKSEKKHKRSSPANRSPIEPLIPPPLPPQEDKLEDVLNALFIGEKSPVLILRSPSVVELVRSPSVQELAQPQPSKNEMRPK